MKKIKLRAFTLIELMAVVLIIGIVSMITVVVINYSIKNAKEKLYKEQINRIETATGSWATDNTDLLPTTGGVVLFDISRLKETGIIDNELVIDPRTNEELTGCMTIIYSETYSQYEYKYEDIPCESVANGYLPTITIANGTTQFLEVNTEYSFPTATAVDYTGKSATVTGPVIKNNSNQVVTNIDSSIVGSTYKLIYSSTDEQNGLTKEETVNLIVRDTVAPTIVCGTSAVSYTVTHPSGPGFVVPTCVVKDNSCGIDEVTTTVNGCASTLVPTVSTVGLAETIPGTYPITYTAKDSSLNTKVFTVTVVVTDTTKPTVSANNASSNWFASRNTTISATDNVAVSEIRYSWNINPMDTECTTGGTVVVNNTSIAVPTGSNRLYLCARDTVGNYNSWDSGSDQYRVDSVAPTISLSGFNPYEINVGSAFVEPTVTATDNTGIAPTVVRITTIPSTSTNGTYTITYRATDQAGLYSEASKTVYIWTAWSAWQDAAVTATGTRQVETKLQQQYRTSSTQLVNTGTQVTTWGYPACVSCSSQWYAPVNPALPWGDTGDKVGNTYFYRADCMRNETVWSGFGAWADTASCAADTGTVDYNCKTVYRYRDR